MVVFSVIDMRILARIGGQRGRSGRQKCGGVVAQGRIHAHHMG
jgi:hypothetical protein